MRPSPDTIGNYALALAGDALGYRFVPCAEGTKVPLVKWKRYQRERPTPDLYERWFRGTRNNIALLTTGLVLFDCDDPAKADLVLAECGDTPHKVRTPRGGVHLGFRRLEGDEVTNRVRINGEPIDLRTDGGLEILPHSRTAAGAYSWLGEGLVPVAELPAANVGWIQERVGRVVRPIDVPPEPGSDRAWLVRRAHGYLSRVEGAVSGQRGHDRTMRAAGILVQKFGLSIPEAWPLFKAWNETCEPPWSDAELMHKLQDALRRRT
ncbi:MAG TPA: bifunctional DNA primase/polymerase [Urbifossiella sp.]|nr:bifunctional DNA primase/polymerase [Urbifossiella sp.]